MQLLALCPPKYLSTEIANNKWMEDCTPEQRIVNIDLAYKQFFNLYSLLAQVAFVYLVPPKKGLQDAVYIANAGVFLPHADVFILANWKAEGRSGEEIVIKEFLEKLEYKTIKCPYKFEGEAELKWIRDNLYIGGYGIRTEKKALEWIEETFGAKIIKIKEVDPYLYHLDCSIFPLDENNIIVATELLTEEEIEELSKYVNIIPVTGDQAYEGITNSVLVGGLLFNAGKSDDTPEQMDKNKRLIEICGQFGLTPVFVDLSEYSKSGAALSCMILHLNRESKKLELT